MDSATSQEEVLVKQPQGQQRTLSMGALMVRRVALMNMFKAMVQRITGLSEERKNLLSSRVKTVFDVKTYIAPDDEDTSAVNMSPIDMAIVPS